MLRDGFCTSTHAGVDLAARRLRSGSEPNSHFTYKDATTSCVSILPVTVYPPGGALASDGHLVGQKMSCTVQERVDGYIYIYI